MSDDVVMLDVNCPTHEPSPTRSPAEIPPTSRSSHHSSISAHSDVIELSSRDNSPEPTTDHDKRTLVSDVDHDVKPPPSKKMRHSASAAGSKPVSAAGAGAKPKSSKPSRPRSPSPTPPPPALPPPFETIRLDIKLGGPENYEVDIASIAKASGQRQPTPPPPKLDITESEGEGEGEVTQDNEAKPKRKKKKPVTTEYYDVTDPFIDDSELTVDNRTHFAQTKQQGFYVSSGEVALMKDMTPKKPKSKKPPATEPAPSKQEDGTKDHPISLLGDEKVGKKRKNYTIVEENGKKRKVVDLREFHPELQAAIEDLKAAISKESWDVKGKFPPAIKPILADAALKAVKLGEYDEDFFSLMPVLFPYNRFTMSKLIKRTIFHDHLKILTDRQDELLEQLAVLTKEGFPKAKEEWEKSVAAWGNAILFTYSRTSYPEKRQEKAKAESDAGGTASTPGAGDAAHHEEGGNASGADGEGAPGTGKPDASKDAHPPAQKYRLTEAMKSTVWQLVMLSNECCRLENEKNELEGNNTQVSEQGSRKVLYQKIVAVFPSNWLNSGQISREVSSMKKKYEKEAAVEHDS
ncbi:hypothetical protein BU15DRAFT_90551 [Melanogaster broomeanus]|nr:hypothetical protein BU15DRAFT_90551 [Melanogaster broomeanus]